MRITRGDVYGDVMLATPHSEDRCLGSKGWCWDYVQIMPMKMVELNDFRIHYVVDF